jgi:AraC-like DNA-binding protein
MEGAMKSPGFMTGKTDDASATTTPQKPASLVEGAVNAGFSARSQFSHHFKRLVGLTPR